MLDKIVDSCHYVMHHAQHLKIHYEKLDYLVSNMKKQNLKHWLSDNSYGLLNLDIELIINFMLLFDSINYSFWGPQKWIIDTEEGLKDGSNALLYCLLKYVKETKSTDFSKMKVAEFKEIIKGNIEIPLLEQRYHTLVENSNIVNKKMGGNFYQYIYSITNDKELFSIIVENFPSFQDERKYNGKTIYFYKLAQLLVSDILHLRSSIEKIKVDYSHLIGCADYKIPQILRALEIIEYDKELSKLIDNKQELEVSSKYEVEIRASMLVVIEYVKDKLSDINAIDINDYFYILGKKEKDIVKPYHLCRNTNY